MITREQIADLQPGDVVEIAYDEYPDVVLRGKLHRRPGGSELRLGPNIVRDETTGQSWEAARRTLTVVSRAPRPLYVNHPRTEPAPGDVVREDGTDRACTWVYEDPSDADEPWRHILGQLCGTHQVRWTRPSQMPARLRLLVDGEIGQVVAP